MIVRQTTPEEQGRVDELFALAFETPLKKDKPIEWQTPITHWAAFDEDGVMTSTLGVTDYDIGFDGAVCQMGGVGGVASLPSHRRQGGIRACFQSALPELYRRGFAFSYLYPFSTAYYRQFGYESCVRKLQATVDLAKLLPPEADGYLRLAEPGRDMSGAVRSLDERWEKRYNMMVRHKDGDWDHVAKAEPAFSQTFCYVYFSKDGEPLAYTEFHKEDRAEGRCLICSKFCFANREGFHGLLKVFRNLSADHQYAWFQIPMELSMQYMMPEWIRGAVRWELAPSGMVRVVNAEKVLRLARYLGSGEAVLALEDNMIPENNGRFAVRFDNGRAVSVERTSAEADVSLPISVFSALICGVSDLPEAARWMKGVDVHNEDAPLERIFYQKPLMIVDHF